MEPGCESKDNYTVAIFIFDFAANSGGQKRRNSKLPPHTDGKVVTCR